MNRFYFRRYVISGIIILIFAVIIIRLFFLQIITSSYKLSADNNVIRYEYIFPARGLILDRKGKILVYNEAVYDIMVVPNQLKKFDTTELCKIFEITKEYAISKLNEAKNYSRYKPSIFLKQVPFSDYSKFQEKLFKYPGFFVQARTLRKYPRPIASHLLGYVGEVDQQIISNNSYYQQGDYIGISGLEKAYEEILRGKKGVKIKVVDVHNRIKGSYKDGKYDIESVIGTDINITIDGDLQEYGEKLMQNKTGSIVAIEPSSGEILAMVSSPTYNPALLIGRQRTKNYEILSADSTMPLFNRAVMAKYPPGSTFKLINGLIALNEKTINLNTYYSCYGGYAYKNIFVGCHIHPSPNNIIGGIQNSCNAFFCNVFRGIIENPANKDIYVNYNIWRNHVLSFGFGNTLGSDITNELKGFIPTSDYYDKYYGKYGWNSLTIISLSIGQGELGITPLQMANMTAAIANKGHYFTPHLLKSLNGKDTITQKFKQPHYTTIDTVWFSYIIEGMRKAVNEGGTAWRAKINGIIVCGKTGTAENPHGEDHSIFIAFAPVDTPKIAISVYVENGGFGNTYAAPIARLMIEKYLRDSISDPYLEKYILDTKILNIKRGKKK